MEKETDEHIAGEYVLGTLSHEERQAVKTRLQSDPEFASLFRDWEQKLSPLDEQGEEIAPPLSVWQTISNRIDQDNRPQTVSLSETVAQLKTSRNRWCAAFVGAMALAASFVGLQISGSLLPYLPFNETGQERLVAILNPTGSSPGFIIRVDVGRKKLEIERLANKAPSGKDYELWLIEPEQSPKSLNVVGRSDLQQINYTKLDNSLPDKQPLTFAITLEPEGGSPTGKATGPIVFSGQLFTQ